MKKLVSLVVLGALLLAACGGGSGAVAATVDGTDITVGEVESLISTEAETVSKAQFAEALTYAIQWDVLFAAAEADYGLVATDEEVEAEANRIYDEFAAEGETRETFLSQRGITEAFLTNIAHQGLLDLGIREILVEDVPEPTREELDTARENAVLSQTEVCVSHILVATEEEADDVMARLGEGEEFGVLAMELSTDTGSGANNGILPCSPPNGYVEPFQDATLDATVGEVYPDPVESEFGWHVILVTDRTEPTEEELPTDEELAEGVRGTYVVEDLQEWFNTVMEAADVTVEEEYGTWSPNPPTVTPPVDGSTSTTTSE